MLLWVIFAALTAAVLYALLRPLAGRSVGAEPRAAFDASVYRDQLREVESDRDRGLIGEADVAASRLEIAKRLLAADAEAATSPPAAKPSPAKAIAIGLALLLPVAALSLYLLYGSPSLPDQPLVARLEAAASEEDIPALIAKVEQRLRENPNEGQGWDLIAPVYMRLGRYTDAAEAYRQSIRLLGGSAARLSGLGQSLVLANDGIVPEPARLALEQALKLDPDLIEPKLFLAIAKEQDGKYAEAAESWKALLASAPPGAPWRAMVEERLAADQTRAAGGTPPQTAEAAPDGGAVPDKGPNAADVAAAQGMSPSDRQAMIERMVQGLADRLAQNGEDLAGWLKLVRAYTVLDRKDDARKALDRAKSQFSGNSQALEQLDALASELGLKS